MKKSKNYQKIISQLEDLYVHVSDMAKIDDDDSNSVWIKDKKALQEAIGIIDDYEKAKSYANQHQNYGPKKLSFIFYQMGLDREMITEILEDDEDEQIEKIKILWRKLGNKEDKKKIESILRKGFLYKDIKRAMSLLEEEEDE